MVKNIANNRHFNDILQHIFAFPIKYIQFEVIGYYQGFKLYFNYFKNVN